jgi:hypothetical protein
MAEETATLRQSVKHAAAFTALIAAMATLKQAEFV